MPSDFSDILRWDVLGKQVAYGSMP